MRAIALVVLLGLTGRSAAEDAGWIRVTTEGRAVLFRPDGTGRSGAAAPAGPRRQPSPDGRHTLFVDPAGEGSVHLAAADGTGDRKVTPEGVPAGAAIWSPDSRRIAFVVRRGDHWQVHV